MKQSSALPIAWVVLQLLILLNFLSGLAILALVGATVVARDWTLTALGIPPGHDIRLILPGLQAIAGLGLVAILLNHAVLKRLLACIETVRRGDPFVSANAIRLQVIAWALLAIQLLSLAIAGIGKAISTKEVPVALDAGFSPSGWLAVLLTFVLARVFAEGTHMREDLEGMV